MPNGELLLAISTLLSGDVPKGIIQSYDHRFSKKLEKHEELDILSSFISYISRTETANLSKASDAGVTTAKSENETISHDETFFSGSSSYCRLQPNSRHAHEDLNYPNEENRNESRQVEQPIGVSGPKPDYIWLLPEIVILEELPRLRVWPSQFIESQATEEDIDLFFFAKDQFSYATYYKRLMEYLTTHDLALKGNFDGVELLIFPSNVLPEKSQRLNKSLFLWGVFKRQKLENRDCKSKGASDLNIYPEDENDMATEDEVGKFNRVHSSPSEDQTLYAGCSDSSQSLHGGRESSDSLLLDRDLLVQSERATLEDGAWMSAACVGGKTNIDDQGDIPMVEKNDADNVEVQGMLPMEENNNANNVDPSIPPSPSLIAPTIREKDEDLNVWLAAVTLYFLSKRS
ncbi:hypothetical protein RIF29_35439 [Crotalaria pallida]|uniref:AIPP2-like SPOC-like domain-containing protein n=1 Tax=Crotalaria pallida TaxID=3830 RepID=A0AAN9EFM6_CROPI